MTAKEQAFLQSLEQVNPGQYDAPLWKLGAIITAYHGDFAAIASRAFLMGFKQGQKAARAAEKGGKL